MATSFFTALVLAGAVGCGISSAWAQQSMAVLGTTPTEQCAAAAATAGISGKATTGDLATCAAAARWIGLGPHDRPAILVNSGILYQARGAFDAALKQFNAALILDPDFSEALSNRGVTLSSMHRYSEAEADFTHALALKPAHPETVYFNRAFTYEDAGNLKQAYLDYRRAARANPQWALPAKEMARFTVARPAEG